MVDACPRPPARQVARLERLLGEVRLERGQAVLEERRAHLEAQLRLGRGITAHPSRQAPRRDGLRHDRIDVAEPRLTARDPERHCLGGSSLRGLVEGADHSRPEQVLLDLGRAGWQELGRCGAVRLGRLLAAQGREEGQRAARLEERLRSDPRAIREEQQPPPAPRQAPALAERRHHVRAGGERPGAQRDQGRLDGVAGGRLQDGAGGGAAVEGDEGEAVLGAERPEHAHEEGVGGFEPRPAVREGSVEQDREGDGRPRSRGLAASGARRGGGGHGLEQEEAVLLGRDLGGPLPGGEREPVGQHPLRVAEGGEQEGRALPGSQPDHDVPVHAHVLARVRDLAPRLGVGRPAAGGGDERVVEQVHVDGQGARHRRLAVGRSETEAELPLPLHEGHLLLELQLDPLGRPGGDRRHPDRERRAPGGPAGGARLFLALLQEARVDALAGELAVDGPRALLLEDHARNALEVVPDREVAHHPRGRQAEPVRPFLGGAGLVLEDLADVHPGVAAGDPDVDHHVAQGQYGCVGAATTGGHEQSGLTSRFGGHEESRQGKGRQDERAAVLHGSSSFRGRRASPSSVPIQSAPSPGARAVTRGEGRGRRKGSKRAPSADRRQRPRPSVPA